MPNPDTVNLTDKAKKNHIKLVLENGNWVKYESKDRINWKKIKTNLSLDDVMKEKEEVKNKNYFNLFNFLLKRK